MDAMGAGVRVQGARPELAAAEIISWLSKRHELAPSA